MIIELINNITDPLHLPDWTPAFVIVLLAIGFPIVIIFSWIYDIHPEGGMVKTEPTDKVKDEVPKSSNGWKIASYISFVVIIGLIVLHVIPRSSKYTLPEKSIAVLPFINDSPEEAEMYFINGTMESILDNLCKIEDLRVVSRTSTEQYRNNPKPITTVGKEMNVSYVIEGSGLRHGDKIRLTVQLIDAIHDQHLWSQTYDRKTTEIFELQSEIAQLVAKEIKAIVTEDEKQIIERIPTQNTVAYDLYLKGRDQYNFYIDDREKNDAIDKAISLFQLVLEYDSSYARAYTGLAMALQKSTISYFTGGYTDSILALANTALAYDNQLEEAYQIRGDYYFDYGNYEQALLEYERVLVFNPNYWQTYTKKAEVYSWTGNYVDAILNYQKAILINRGAELPILLRDIGRIFGELKMYNTAEYYLEEALSMDMDTLRYNRSQERIRELYDFERGKVIFTEWLDWGNNMLENDSSVLPEVSYRMGYANSVLGKDEEAFKFWKIVADRSKSSPSQGRSISHRIGYAYWQVGKEKEAQEYSDALINHCKESIVQQRPYANRMAAHYDLAGCYAFMGESDSAYHYLHGFLENRNYFGSNWNYWISFDPMFNKIRNETSFQNIIEEMKAKDQYEQERVKAWLMEHDMIIYD